MIKKKGWSLMAVIKLLLGYLSIGIILYILTCIKNKRIKPVKFKLFIKNVLLAPFLILKLIWEEL